MKRALFQILFLVAVINGHAAGDGMFPFVLPWDDDSAGVTDISSWLEKPAGAAGFVQVKEGHLFEGSKRIRFFGVNTVFGASFPKHEDAEKVAARMAKFGINCVRFHHMDMFPAPGGILQADLKTLDPGQLDRLDYFIAKLKEHGIYSDLNLHVSRTYPGMPLWEGAPGFLKGVDLFYLPIVEMQRDYARQLLSHVNPYTKNSYANESAVALIEINNENGLILEWSSGELDNMPELYRNALAVKWNDWLVKKYATRDALKIAWQTGTDAPGEEMLRDGNFTRLPSGDPWLLEQHGKTKALALAEEAPGGGVRIQVQETDGVGWHVQLTQAGLSFDGKRSYTLSFKARAETPQRIVASASKAGDPWTGLWQADFDLTKEWKEYRMVFGGQEEPKGRIVFSNLGAQTGTICFENVSLKPGGVSGLGENENPGTISPFSKKDFGSHTAAAREDWMNFLWDAEESYWTGMADFIKKDLKAGSLVVGTATGFSPSPIQAKLDVVDSHAYWHHPQFPGNPWDPENWMVDNESMAGADKGGAFSEMALRRVQGKPFICTEYNAAAPNTHAGETFLLLSAYASLQDWDGIFAFAWSHRQDDWDSGKISGFFDIDQHPAKMVTLPAAAALFVRGDVVPSREIIRIPVSRSDGIAHSLKSGPWWDLGAFGVDKNTVLRARTQMELTGLNGSEKVPGKMGEVPSVIVSDTSELTWDQKERRVLITTARSKAVIGKTIEGPVMLGDVSVEVLSSMQGWAAISLTAMTGPDFKSPGKILITASGSAENTGMIWKNPEKNSVGKNWGKAPSLAEGIGAKFFFPVPSSNLRAWVLDGRGQRAREIPIQPAGTGSLVEIGPDYQTLWYELEIQGSEMPKH